LPVIGSYPSTDPDRALRMLEGVLPIRIKRTLPWWVSIELAEHRP
jgi:transmembrane sensor